MTDGIRHAYGVIQQICFFVINKSLKEATTVIKSR